MKKTIRRTVTAVVVLAVGATAFVVLRGNTAPLPPVKTAPAALVDLRSVTSATGSVQPIRQIALSFPSVGRVSQVSVQPGDRVAAGTVVAEVDSATAKTEVKIRQAALNEAVARAQGLQRTVTAADKALYTATLSAAQSTAKQAARSEVQLAEVNDASAAQFDNAIDAAATQQQRDAATLSVDSTRVDDAQNKLNENTASRVEAKTFLDVAKANLDIAQKRRDEVRDQLALARQESTNLGVTRDEAQRALDKAIADYERQRSLLPTVDASGNPLLVFVPDTAVVNARTALAAVAAKVSAAEANVVSVQATFEVANDAVVAATTALANAQTKFDTFDGKVTAGQASLEAARTKVEAQRESAARAADAVKNAKVAKEAGIKRDEQAMVSAENARIAAESSARTAAREKRQKEQLAKPSDVRAALATVDSAAASLELARDTLDKTQLKAPFDGVIASVGFKQGEQVGTSAAALGSTSTKDASNSATIVIVDTSSVVIRLPLPEIDAAKVTEGQTATITFESLGDSFEALKAKIDSVEPTPTVVNGVSTYNARITINDVPKTVKLGMTATVEVLLKIRKQVLTVPAESLSEKNGETQVNLVTTSADNKQVITLTEVTVGDRGDGKVEIVRGVKKGDLVKLPDTVGGAK
jgi:multidrug efflux pump subunit AcrA (membrane-fusion protein)